MSRSAVEFAPPTAADIDELAARMRAQDTAEVHALRPGVPLRGIVQDSVDASAWALAARADGALACIFGLARAGTVLAPIGVPWMLGTPTVLQHKRSLNRLARRYIKQMLQETPILLNAVHADNTVAVNWLKRMGFELQAPVATGALGAPFHEFRMARDV